MIQETSLWAYSVATQNLGKKQKEVKVNQQNLFIFDNQFVLEVRPLQSYRAAL